jgi:hypothetical protein
MMSRFQLQVWLLAMVTCVGLWAAPLALAEEKPRHGGVLRVAHAADPLESVRTRVVHRTRAQPQLLEAGM